MQVLERSELPSDYSEMMETESHHNQYKEKTWQ